LKEIKNSYIIQQCEKILFELEHYGFHTIAYEAEIAWQSQKPYIIPKWVHITPKFLINEIENINYWFHNEQ